MKLLLVGSFDAPERERWVQALRQALPEHQLLLQAQNAERTSVDVAVVANPPPLALQGLPSLRLIQSLWAGVDGLLADASVPTGVPIARMVDAALGAAMGETALWAVLSLQRGFFTYQEQQRQRVWLQHAQPRAEECPITVLGLGEMGCAVADRLVRQGYRVSAWRRNGHEHPCPSGVAVVQGDEALWTLLPRTQIVINLLPLTARTRGLLDARFFTALPSGSSIVNFARGAHLVDADLLDALDRGHLRHAVLDVFHTEPLPSSHRFWSHPQVTALPHVAALTDERSAAQVVARNLAALQAGDQPLGLVDRARGY
jgi:glyoxylate/hydroxypyruvate reductase A